MSWLILEGADGTGKTTLAHELGVRYGVGYRHVGPPTNPAKAFSELVDMVLGWGDWDLVVDRFHLGNQTYGPIFRGSQDLDNREWKLIEHMLDKVPAALVLCDPPFSTVKTNLGGKARDPRGYEDNMAQQQMVYDRMRFWFDASSLPRMKYDYTRGNKENLHKFLEHRLEWQPLAVGLTE